MFKVFYKSSDKSLHQIDVGSVDNVELARTSVMEYLHNNQERYLKPILVLVQGGKA